MHKIALHDYDAPEDLKNHEEAKSQLHFFSNDLLISFQPKFNFHHQCQVYIGRLRTPQRLIRASRMYLSITVLTGLI